MEFNKIHKVYNRFLALYPKYETTLFAALDTEYVSRGQINKLISSQIAVASVFGTYKKIIWSNNGKRLPFKQVVAEIFRTAIPEHQRLQLRGKTLALILVGHHFLAEWATFEDRNANYLVSKINLIQKSPVTSISKIQIVIDKSWIVDVFIYDTMLILPLGFKGLGKASSLLGPDAPRKVKISQFYIENMDLYLRDHPEKFIRYALMDVEVTLRLFFLLQKNLNELVSGKVERLYKTIGSAAVKKFQRKNKWFKKYRKALKGKKYYDAYSFFKRAYYGGRNEAYFIGRSDNYPETSRQVFIDVDLIGCYLTAMAFCVMIDLDAEVDFILNEYKPW